MSFFDEGEWLVGVDFAGPGRVWNQRRKIVAVAAERLAPRRYRVDATGFNARIPGTKAPGWSAEELAVALEGAGAPSLLAFDFPFSIPAALLRDAAFARAVGAPEAFGSWRAFNAFVASRLPLQGPALFAPFAGWRRGSLYWTKRLTDVAASAQPPLKDKFQVLFNMTLLGNALLARLSATARYRVDPFEPATPGTCSMIEVYPGLTMRRLDRSDYKQRPAEAIDAMLAHCASLDIRVDLDESIRSRCVTYGMKARGADPDVSDALIAACIAILHREGHTQPALHDESHPDVALEGAMWALVTPSASAAGRAPSATGL